MTTREEELSKLREIKSLLERKNGLTKRKKQLTEKYDAYLSDIESASYQILPTDNEIKARMQNKIIITQGAIRTVITIIALVAGFLICLQIFHPFNENLLLGMWLIFGGFVLFFGYWIRKMLIFLSDLFKKGDWVFEKKANDFRAEIEEDERNRKENVRRHEEAKKSAREKLQEKMDAINQERNRLDAEIRQIDKSIADMHLIGKDDLLGIDFLIERIVTHRADSLKEALRDLDIRREKTGQEVRAFVKEFNEQRDRECQAIAQARKEEQQFWDNMREQERRREHEKKVEDELQRMREMLEDE